MNAFLLPPLALLVGALALRSKHTKKMHHYCDKKNSALLPPVRSPENVIITFDLHGVVFRHDYRKMARFFWESPDKWKLSWATLSPKLWLDVLRLARTCTVPEAFIMRLAQQHATIKELLPVIIHIMNAQVPHEPTVELMHKLKKQGYQLHVISNIGETIYRDLEKQFPDILQMFENVVVTSAANGYISKPNPEMYYTYLSTINSVKKPLFIDDKIKNIRSALNCGIASIYYEKFDQAHGALKKLVDF